MLLYVVKIIEGTRFQVLYYVIIIDTCYIYSILYRCLKSYYLKPRGWKFTVFYYAMLLPCVQVFKWYYLKFYGSFLWFIFGVKCFWFVLQWLDFVHLYCWRVYKYELRHKLLFIIIKTYMMNVCRYIFTLLDL